MGRQLEVVDQLAAEGRVSGESEIEDAAKVPLAEDLLGDLVVFVRLETWVAYPPIEGDAP